MKIVLSALGSLALLAFTGCQNTAINTVASATTGAKTTTAQHPSYPILIAEVNNLSTEPDAKRNSAKLMQEHQFCLIEFTGYFPKAKVTEHWAMVNTAPVSASVTIEHFSDDALTLALSSESSPLDHSTSEQQQNFSKLLNYFKAEDIARCNQFS